jgi:hypothetical protein
MRHYDTNSPQAAARIIAMALLAEGEWSESKVHILDRLQVHEVLGMHRSELHSVLQAFYKDMHDEAQQNWFGSSRVDPRTMTHMLAELESPWLRRTVLQLCIAIVEDDQHVSDDESLVLSEAVEQWNLQRYAIRRTQTLAA